MSKAETVVAQTSFPLPSRETIVTCEGVGKAYQLYMHRNDQLKQTLFGRWRKFYREHWVLRNVTFEVARGECVGIIGRNGAGKTTLLQILCGITTPTHGAARIKGRVAPILALGTGFDQELTGRENVLIGGAILGLKKREILERMDAIAEFADIGSFFYQPMKMYSSGMQSRLAFAICAHADADILIIDEALSVGDAEFVSKCDTFIKDFAARGTIIVVSHSAETMQQMCDRIIWIEAGIVQAIGEPDKVVPMYKTLIGG